MGRAHRAYGVTAGEPALILARPDGYLGLVVRDDAHASGATAQYLAPLMERRSEIVFAS